MKKFFTILLSLVAILFVISCDFLIDIPYEKMYEHYLTSAEYEEIYGEIVSYEGVVVQVKIATEKTKNFSSGATVSFEFFGDIKDLNEIELGSEIKFVIESCYFYNGHILPMVALVCDEKVILDFEDGKANLIAFYKGKVEQQNHN